MGDVSPAYIRDVLDYDRDEGALTWRTRSESAFAERKRWLQWGTRYAGRPALTTKSNGYLVGTIAGKRHYAHRVAWCWMTGEWPQGEIDHINGDKADNRFVNLRVATRAENQRNVGPRRAERRFKGTRFCGKKWRAAFVLNGRKVHLGMYPTEEAAARAYDAAARAYHGSFARLNFPD